MKTILIVEDEESFREMVSDSLKDAGYETLTAQNGKEGLDILKNNQVDLVLLDIMMPEMTGTVFVYEMKNTLKKNVPIIVLTNLEKGAYQDSIWTVLIKSNTSLEQIVNTVNKYLGGEK